MPKTGKQSALLVTLAAEQSMRDAAKTAGGGEWTAHRWLANDASRRRAVDLRQEMVGRAKVGCRKLTLPDIPHSR